MALIDYIDTKKTTISILRDWRDQLWKAKHSKEEIKKTDIKMASPSYFGAGPVTGGDVNKVEDAVIRGITKKDALEQGYNKAVQYMREIEPCWKRLTEDEKYMLTVRFIDYGEGDGIRRIMDRYFISKAEAYKRSNAALDRLSKLLFW